jgi:hypothetical protein
MRRSHIRQACCNPAIGKGVLLLQAPQRHARGATTADVLNKTTHARGRCLSESESSDCARSSRGAAPIELKVAERVTMLTRTMTTSV